MGNSPAIYGGSRTKILTSKGLLLKDGTPIDFNGPKNYITKGTFATNATTGWELKRTTLSNKIPNQVAASWTTPSVLTLSATTTGALTNSGYSLSLAASAATTAGDMLVSDAYTIDIEDQAKVLNFKFSYKAYANASNMNFSGTSSNTFHVYIYDVTNNAWIQPAGCYTMVQNSGVGIGYGTFQTPANMTQFRIAIVSCNASSGAFTLYTDNFFVGPQQFNMGPPVTDSILYSASFGGFGTVSTQAIYQSRIGDKLRVTGRFVCGTVAASTASVSLPSGLVANVSSGVNSIVGKWWRGNFTANTWKSGTLLLTNGSTTVYFGNDEYVPAYSPESLLNANVFAATGDTIWIEFTVPISGWSSNTVMSSDAATNVVALHVQKGSLAPQAANTPYNFGPASVDTNNAWNGSTIYTIPVSGIYKLSAQLQFNITASTSQYFNLGIAVNGTASEFQTKRCPNSGMVSDSFVLMPMIKSLKAGDQITLVNTGTNYSSITASTDGSWFSIERISGPAQIAASETVAARYTITAGGTPIPNASGTVLTSTYATYTKNFDTHNTFNTTTGSYTCPVSGKYRVTAMLGFASQAMVNTAIFDLNLRINTNTYSSLGFKEVQANTTNTFIVNGSDEIQCIAGDKLDLTIFQNNGGTRTLSSDYRYGYVIFERVGN